MTDPIDRAINTVEVTVRMVRIPLTVAPHGRPIELHVPADITTHEVMEFIAWLSMSGGLRKTLGEIDGGIVVAKALPS